MVQEKILERYGKTFDWSLKAQMMGRKAIESARIFVEASGLTGLLSPEAFLEERESMLQELFPSCTLLPGTVFCLRNIYVISADQRQVEYFMLIRSGEGKKSIYLSEPVSTTVLATMRLIQIDNVPNLC